MLKAQQPVPWLIPIAVSPTQARFRGYFVPPRPEKNAVEGQRMSDAFIEDRRSSLEKYLRKLASHPVIGPSEVGGRCLCGEMGSNRCI